MATCRYDIGENFDVKFSLACHISTPSSMIIAIIETIETRGILISALGETSLIYRGWSLGEDLQVKYLQAMFQVHQTPKKMSATPAITWPSLCSALILTVDCHWSGLRNLELHTMHKL